MFSTIRSQASIVGESSIFILGPDLRVEGVQTVASLVSILAVVELCVDVAGHVAGVDVGVDDGGDLAVLLVRDAVDVLGWGDVAVGRAVGLLLHLPPVVEPGHQVLGGAGGAGGAAGVLTVRHGPAVFLVPGRPQPGFGRYRRSDPLSVGQTGYFNISFQSCVLFVKRYEN